MNQDHQRESERDNGTRFRAKWAFVAFALIAAYFLTAEHKAHLLGWLSAYGIWLLVLACPLLHLFMHRGHGSHGSHGHRHGAEKKDMK